MILSMAEAERLLRTVETFRDGELPPHIVLTLLCGLRLFGNSEGIIRTHYLQSKGRGARCSDKRPGSENSP